MHEQFRTWIARFFCCLALFTLNACGDDDSGGTLDAGGDRDAATSSQDSGAPADAGQPECVADPKTHLEIINACTDAQAIDKHPTLPLLQADGGLPPLP